MAGEVLAHVQGASPKANAAVSGGFLTPRSPAPLVTARPGSFRHHGPALQPLRRLAVKILPRLRTDPSPLDRRPQRDGAGRDVDRDAGVGEIVGSWGGRPRGPEE